MALSTPPPRQDPARETRERMAQDMRRLGQQGEKIIGGGFDADHPDGAADDAIEIWGKRIGRGLGFLFALYLIWHLFSKYLM